MKLENMSAGPPVPKGVRFVDLEPPVESFRRAILDGLAATPKRIPSKFFYDETGSRLFGMITELDVYYPTRTEKALLREISTDLRTLVPDDAHLVEFGSGSSEKVRIILNRVANFHHYMAIDISRDILLDTAAKLKLDFPDLDITAVCADYTHTDRLPGSGHVRPGQRIGFFPGSTIGNLEVGEAVRFLRDAGRLLGSGAGFLVGADLVKDTEILETAYNDAGGVTSAFNLNVLARINRELNANFDLTRFAHLSYFDSELERIEMHIVSEHDQRVQVAGEEFIFAEGERVHTENSHKYTKASFQALAREAGLVPEHYWQDAKAMFSIHFLRIP